MKEDFVCFVYHYPYSLTVCQLFFDHLNFVVFTHVSFLFCIPFEIVCNQHSSVFVCLIVQNASIAVVTVYTDQQFMNFPLDPFPLKVMTWQAD